MNEIDNLARNIRELESKVFTMLETVKFLESARDAAVDHIKRGKTELALLVLEGTKGFEYLQKNYSKHD